jgi:exodeoxyribonuclease VII large subunit
MAQMPRPISPDDVLSVAELTRRLKEALESEFSRVAVAGEITDLTISSAGHAYFSLADDESQIRATLWRSVAQRLKFELKDGLQVVCQGGVQIYPPRGTYSLNVTQLEPVGIGAQQLAFQQLFEKLKDEGLFDQRYKHPIPEFARRIGIVTSPTGAAIHDILQSVRRRWRAVDLHLFPSLVQGDDAPPQLVRAIESAGRLRPALDVVIVARGGGSQDDIACFNDERVVRAVFACPIPTISAVGHEVDVTLCDLVADVRALTPSHAGELVVPDGAEIAAALQQWSARLRAALARRAELSLQRWRSLALHPVFRRPFERWELSRQHCVRCGDRIARGSLNLLARHRAQISELAARLQNVSPVEVLARGYSMTLDGRGKPIRDYRQVAEGDRITTELSRGRLHSRVESRDADNTAGYPATESPSFTKSVDSAAPSDGAD